MHYILFFHLLFLHGLNLLFVSSFEFEDRGPMSVTVYSLSLARLLKISAVLNFSPGSFFSEGVILLQ